MSFNRSLLTQISKDLADKKKPAKPKAGPQQKIGDSNPYYIDKSDIAGKGAFAKQFIPKGSPIDMLHQINQPGVDYDFTQLGRSYNHSENPNTVNRLQGNQRFMVANQDIYPGQELTGDYRMQPDLEQPQEDWKMRNGGYTVTRSHDRKGKTHKVTGPDGTVKYFGDSKLGQHPNDPERKAAFYARHKKNLDGNPYFRAFAKATWQTGGEVDIDGQALQGLGKVFSTIGDVMSIPARGVVKALTGKYQDPSQALGVTNPVAAWLTNSILDPTNLVGAGVAAKVLGTAGKASKASKIVKGVDQAVDAVKGADKVAGAGQAYKIAPPRNIPIEPSKYRAAAHDAIGALTERGMILDQQGAFKKPLTPNDIEYFGTLSGRPVVGVNTPNGPEYFYKSTAWAPKTHGTVEGEWQAFGQYMDAPEGSFAGVKGITTDWFVKGDRYKQWYDSQTFKNIAKQMDNVIMQKYGLPEKDLDKFLNFQNRQGWVDTFTPPRQNGGQTYSQLAQNAKNFLKTWNNSPMAQQMLQNSVDQDDPWGLNSAHAEAITDVRNKLIDQAKVNVVVPGNISTSHNGIDAKRGDSNMAGYASYGNWNETLGSELGSFKNPSNYLNHRAPAYVKYQNALSKEIEPGQVVIYADNREQNIDESLLHELSHQSDWSSYFMPNSDIYKIQRYSKPGVKGNFTRYVAKPTETRARLNNFRYNAWKQGLYDPFNQKVNEQQLKKYKRTSWGLDPLEQLRDVYNDKQITDMLNTVSYNEKGPNPEQAQVRYGGESDNVKKFMDVYHMKYGGGTPAFKEGGQTRDEREMVNGIADILSKVKDRGNRGEIAQEMIQDFEDEGVTYNVKKFMDMVNLKYGGVPYTHFQEGGEADVQPEYTGSSIVDYLQTKGFSGSKQFRKKLAQDMGIEGYNYSAKKNLELLNRLRENEELPEGYEQEFAPRSAEEMIALEQQRGVYAPMPEAAPVPQQVVSHPMSQTAVPMAGVPVNVPVTQAKQAVPVSAKKAAAQAAPNAFRIPMAAPGNPYAGFFDPRIPQNTVPASKAPVAAPVTRGKINPFAAVQPAGSFPGGFNQQQALAAIQNAAAPSRSAAPVKKKVAAPVIKPGIVKLNEADETNEENGKAWYTEIADAFSNAVNKAPFDFSKIGLGSTGPNPHFDREALQNMIVKAAKLVSPEKGVLADSYFKRQALKNNDNLKETKTKFEVPKSGKPAIVTGDTISIDKDRYVIPAMIDLNQTKWGVRNRDEFKNINTEAADITTFQSFENAKDYFKKNLSDPYNSTYVGVDAKGNVKVGNRIDFSGTDYRISKTFGNKIVDFVDEPSGSMKLKPTSSKASNRHLSPVVQVMGDDGKVVEGSMNLLIPKKSKDTHSFGQITGGRVIFKTPKGEQYLVSGSAEDIKKAFKQIKGNNPYVEAVTLDNGSYAMGLRNKNQKITADQLRAYQGSNSTGSAFLYLQPGNYTRQSSVAPPAAAAPKFQFKDVQMKTPNIRTEKDESFKKGHSLKNEQKAIILHHTGYSDASGIDKGMSAAMRGVNQQFSKPGESSHVVIDFDGTRYNYAKPDQVTFHAGKSYLNGRDNVNDFGIGIEFQGDTDRKHLTDKQINSFVEYIAPIIKKNKIPLSSVVTHKKIRQDYMKTNPQDKDVYSKPDLNEYDYKRILKALKDKKVYKFGGSTTSSWLDKYN